MDMLEDTVIADNICQGNYNGIYAWNVRNVTIENNEFSGIAIADYCLTVFETDFDCDLDPTVTPEYREDETALYNTVAGNVLIGNGTNPDPDSPFAPLAADLIFAGLSSGGNCFEDNTFSTFFSFIGTLPADCEVTIEPACGLGWEVGVLALPLMFTRRFRRRSS